MIKREKISINSIDLDILILLFVGLILVVDSVNGIILQSGLNFPISLSQLYKFLLLIIISLRLLHLSKLNSILVFIFLIYSILTSFYHFVINENVYELVDSTLQFSKFLFIIILFCYCSILIKIKPQLLNIILRIIKFNLLILILNLILGVFGLGYSSYDSIGIGIKGYFYAANELSGLVLILFPFYLYLNQMYRKGFNLRYYVIGGLFIIFSILVATKTAIIGTIITVMFIPFLYNNKMLSFTLKLKPFLFKSLLIFIFIILLILIVPSLLEQTGLVNKYTYVFENRDLIRIIFSGRTNLAQTSFQEFISSNNIIKWFIGKSGYETIEMDFFNTLFSYGLFGILIIYSFFFYLIAVSFKKVFIRSDIVDYPYAKIVLYINVLILIISTIAGHIVYSAMTGPFLGIVNSLTYYKTTKNKKTILSVN